MAKKKKGKRKKKEIFQVTEKEEVLTEWQIRNKEYLARKAQETAQEEEQLALKKKERLGELEYEDSEEEEDVKEQEVDAEEKDDETAEDTPEKKSVEEPELDETSEEEAEKDNLATLSTKDLKAAIKKRKKAEKLAAKAKREPKIAKRHIYRALPIFILAFGTLLLSAYFMSPWSSQKEFLISGNKEVGTQAILDKSGIDGRDYTLTTYLHQEAYAKNIQSSNPWIEKVDFSYQFPTTFKIRVREYAVVAYTKKDTHYYPILANGIQIKKALTLESLPETFMNVEIANTDMLKKFVQQMEKVPPSVKEAIQQVTLTPSKATGDLLTLDMSDGHKVKVPLSELSKKLPYYTVIKEKLAVPSIVDLEAGAYSYAIQQEKSLSDEAKDTESLEEEPELQEQ